MWGGQEEPAPPRASDLVMGGEKGELVRQEPLENVHG